MKLTEKVAFIKGMMEGMKFDSASNEGIIISKLVDLVDDMASAISDLQETTDTLYDYVDELDYDLGDLEEYVYDDDCDCCDDDCDCCCDGDDEEDDPLYEVECPKCHDQVYISESILNDEIKCPNCGEVIMDAAEDDEADE